MYRGQPGDAAYVVHGRSAGRHRAVIWVAAWAAPCERGGRIVGVRYTTDLDGVAWCDSRDVVSDVVSDIVLATRRIAAPLSAREVVLLADTTDPDARLVLANSLEEREFADLATAWRER